MKEFKVKKGDEIIYNDGRAGHKEVRAMVLSTDERGMTVQFEDRADVTRIGYSDKEWMLHIRVS